MKRLITFMALFSSLLVSCAPASTPPTMTPTPVPPAPIAENTPMPESEAPTDAPIATAATGEPAALRSGQFTRIDRAHAAEGTATLYELPDGSLLLRLEQDFRSNEGPDLYVGFSGHPMPRSNEELHDQGYLELALLQSFEGQQDYALPADLNLDDFRSVVIYCKEFTVLFSTAELTGS
jgi:hypothetical protein